jgi:hypothetical protein
VGALETSLTPVEAIVRPWRTATLVAVVVAVVEAALVIALIALLLSSSDGSSAAAAPAAKKPHVAKMLPRPKTRVLVLNGNGRTGAAAAEAEIVRSLRYKVAGVGNAGRSDYGKTVVLYAPGRELEARRLAHDLGIRIVGPLDGMSNKKLHGAAAAVILGR